MVLLVIATIWVVSHWGANQYWGSRGAGHLGAWVIDTWLQYFINAIGIFGSPTKGLFVYCPILLAILLAAPRAFRSHRQLTIFALLLTACTIAFTSIIINPGADGWGPRYLHATVAPLILCIGAAWPTFSWRQNAPLVALSAIGIAISFLGAFYYYGQRDFAMKAADQNTVEWEDGDLVWNPITFDARLFRVWLLNSGSAPVVWTPKHTWQWTPPPDVMPWKTIDLRDYCQPQSFMLRFWHVSKNGTVLRVFAVYLLSLVLGVVMLAWVALRCARAESEYASEFAMEAKAARDLSSAGALGGSVSR
jgi:hypothetical protein